MSDICFSIKCGSALVGYVLVFREGTWTVVVVCEDGPAAYYHMVGVDTVDGEVVDRGCGGVGADVDDPDLLTVRGAELVSGIEVLGVIPARCFAPQAMHGGLKEAAVVVDPERMLRGRDERL